MAATWLGMRSSFWAAPPQTPALPAGRRNKVPLRGNAAFHCQQGSHSAGSSSTTLVVRLASGLCWGPACMTLVQLDARNTLWNCQL